MIGRRSSSSLRFDTRRSSTLPRFPSPAVGVLQAALTADDDDDAEEEKEEELVRLADDSAAWEAFLVET